MLEAILLAVIPGLTRNPEDFEKPGFPIKAFGNDEKRFAVVLNSIKQRMVWNIRTQRQWLRYIAAVRIVAVAAAVRAGPLRETERAAAVKGMMRSVVNIDSMTKRRRIRP